MRGETWINEGAGRREGCAGWLAIEKRQPTVPHPVVVELSRGLKQITEYDYSYRPHEVSRFRDGRQSLHSINQSPTSLASSRRSPDDGLRLRGRARVSRSNGGKRARLRQAGRTRAEFDRCACLRGGQIQFRNLHTHAGGVTCDGDHLRGCVRMRREVHDIHTGAQCYSSRRRAASGPV